MIILCLIIREFQGKKRNSPLNHPKVLLDPTNQGGERARSSQPQPVTNSLHWTRD